MVSPIAQLREIESKSIVKNELVATSTVEPFSDWTGIVFRVGETELITEMDSIVEILNPIECTAVPACKPWFKGIANVRGQLMPISDFYGFLYGKNKELDADSKLMVFRLANTLAGLEVSSVSGIRNFKVASMSREITNIDEQLLPMLQGCFHDSGSVYPVFDFNRLMGDERFMQITEANETEESG